METIRGELFRLPAGFRAEEVTETLAAGPGWRIERIVSAGQATPPGAWYDQPWDEWVALLAGEATLAWEDGRRMPLVAGSWLWIPAGERHRVEATSADPPCVWIAFHAAPGGGAAHG